MKLLTMDLANQSLVFIIIDRHIVFLKMAHIQGNLEKSDK